MIKSHVTIKKPIWNNRSVGIADFRLNADICEVLVDYTDKDGKLLYPYVFQITGPKGRTYPKEQIKKSPVHVYIVPIADLKIVGPREGLAI